MSGCFIRSAGLAAPGLAGWDASLDVLRGVAPYVAIAEAPYAPALLPPNERRRATASVRQAFRAAEDAVNGSGGDARELTSVFASSDADMAVLHRICAALAKEPRVISPTDFHNSVHNAASGYWSIAVHSLALTTTLSAFDASFTVGLLEAAGLVDTQRDVLLVAYDAVAPQPLLAKRPLALSASTALVLSARGGDDSLGRIDIRAGDEPESICANPALEALRVANPALRALPLFELMAAKRAATVTLRGTGELRVAVTFAP
ncbi:MAG: beta-ketoacyl synthase chain length factor [Dokdonella sp.]